MVKRLKTDRFRHRAPNAREVLIVFGEEGFDFGFRKRRRHECAIYFLSRATEGMVLADWTTALRTPGVTLDAQAVLEP